MISSDRERYFDETGQVVRGDFLDFWERIGEGVLGSPITEAMEEDGVWTQYFERAALESPALGIVQLRSLGQEILDIRGMLQPPRPMVVRPLIVDLVYDLPRHAQRRYDSRALAQIQQLVIHHSGADPSIGVQMIARKHVEDHGWPAIGYHFVVEAGGKIFQTNDLTTVSYHARQANATTLGIAFSGNFNASVPTPAQVEAGGRLCAYLLQELSLPLDNVRGHKAFVPTDCPGKNWVEGLAWRDSLMRGIRVASNSCSTEPEDKLFQPA